MNEEDEFVGRLARAVCKADFNMVLVGGQPFRPGDDPGDLHSGELVLIVEKLADSMFEKTDKIFLTVSRVGIGWLDEKEFCLVSFD